MNNKTLTFAIVFFISVSNLFAQSKNELLFIENVGQIHDQEGKPRKDIDYVLQGAKGLTIFISKNKITYQFAEDKCLQRMEAGLVGSSLKAEVTATQKQVYYENHYHNSRLIGRAQSFKKIVYHNIYPHIDWVLKINTDNTFEYEYAVGALGDAGRIQMEYKGAKKVSLSTNGDLIVQTGLGAIHEQAPLTYTKTGQLINSRYALTGNKLSYETDHYAGALVIDPKVRWATYYGDTTMFITTDAGGAKIMYNGKEAVYCSGVTNNVANIATTGAYQSTLTATTGSKNQPYYVKLDTNGNRLYATYFGSSKPSGAGYLTVYNDTVYLSGNDASNLLATAGAQQMSFTPFNNAPFLAKFDPSGNLLWCTYVGGNSSLSSGGTCFVDKASNVYVFSSTDTFTPYIATPGAYKTIPSDSFEAIIVKYNSAGKKIWGTYYGGKGNETIFDAVYMDNDGSGSLYMIGNTTSDTGIATPGAYQKTKSGTNDVMLIKFDTSGYRLWGTYVGGEGIETGYTLCQDGKKNIYVAGQTNSLSGIATPLCYQPAPGGLTDAFVMKFDASGNRLWGTYFGGNDVDGCSGMCNDQWGNVFISGSTKSLSKIADTAAFQKAYSGGADDAYIAAFKPNGKKFWSTYYGGEGSDRLLFAASDGRNVYLSGSSNSRTTNIATKGSHLDTNANGRQKALILKIGEAQIGYTSDTLDPIVAIAEMNLSRSTLQLYPNPNNGNFTVDVKTNSPQAVSMNIVDITGKTIWHSETKTDNMGVLKQNIRIEHLVSGVYFLHCKTEESEQTIEFSKD